MEDFDLLVKWMAKHHPDLDLSGLVIGDVEKELMSDHPSEVIAESMMEEATDVAKGMKEATIVTPAALSLMSSNLLFFLLSFFLKFFFFISLQGPNNISLWARCFRQLDNFFDDGR